MMCTRLTFLKFCGGVNSEGRINREVSGFVRFPCAERAVDAKERTADAIANGLILKNAGRPAVESNSPRMGGLVSKDAPVVFGSTQEMTLFGARSLQYVS